MQPNERRLMAELRRLPPEQQARVADFILLLRQQDQDAALRQRFAQASEAAFAKIWDNDEDAIYDAQ